MTAMLLDAYQDWYCPKCPNTERTRPLPPNASRYHICPGLHMLTAPLVRAGVRCTLIAVERQDYLGRDVQATGDDGKPYMMIQTVYADGHTDALVNAGAASMAVSAGRPDRHVAGDPGASVSVTPATAGSS